MLAFRLVFGILLLAGLLCFAMYIGTSQVVWRQRGLVIVKWTVLAAFGFFADVNIHIGAFVFFQVGVGVKRFGCLAFFDDGFGGHRAVRVNGTFGNDDFFVAIVGRLLGGGRDNTPGRQQQEKSAEEGSDCFHTL